MDIERHAPIENNCDIKKYLLASAGYVFGATSVFNTITNAMVFAQGNNPDYFETIKIASVMGVSSSLIVIGSNLMGSSFKNNKSQLASGIILGAMAGVLIGSYYKFDTDQTANYMIGGAVMGSLSGCIGSAMTRDQFLNPRTILQDSVSQPSL